MLLFKNVNEPYPSKEKHNWKILIIYEYFWLHLVFSRLSALPLDRNGWKVLAKYRCISFTHRFYRAKGLWDICLGFLDWIWRRKRWQRLDPVTPQVYANFDEPYNYRNVLGAAISYGAILPKRFGANSWGLLSWSRNNWPDFYWFNDKKDELKDSCLR